MSDQVKIVTVGKIGSPYGIKGWLKLHSFTELKDNIFNYQPWFIYQNQAWQEIDIESWKYHNNDLIVKFKNIEDREQAKRLTNLEIGINLEQLPKLKDEYYWHDLIGCQVINQKGYQMGAVVDLMETGSNDVLVVKANHNDAFTKQERLIPFLMDDVVKRVDLTIRLIEVEWDAEF